MEDKNIKQKQFWSGAGGDVWVDKQREMDIMLNPLGERAIQGLDLRGETKDSRYRVWMRSHNVRNSQGSYPRRSNWS